MEQREALRGLRLFETRWPAPTRWACGTRTDEHLKLVAGSWEVNVKEEGVFAPAGPLLH